MKLNGVLSMKLHKYETETT